MGKTLLALMAAGALAFGVSSCRQPASLMDGNHRPEITSKPTLTVNEMETYNSKIEATDEDGDKLTYSLLAAPSWISVNKDTGEISGTVPRIKHETVFPMTVRVSDGKDTFTEELKITAKEVFDYIVSPGESIQNAINSAPEGSKVAVRSGTYNQNLNVNKRIFLVGEDGVSLTPSANLPVVTISASGNSSEEPVFLRNFDIYTANTGNDPGSKTGIWIASTIPLSHIGLEDIIITGNNISYVPSGLESGVSIFQNVSVDDLEIENCHFKDLSYGFISGGSINPANPGYLTNLKMKNTILENNSVKGFYVERLSDSILENVTAKDNGNIVLCPSWAIASNAGIDVNLKHGNYQNITFKNLIVTGNGVGSTNGAGLTVKARGTGTDSSYSSPIATLDFVFVYGGTFSGNNYDMMFGEPGKGNTQPASIRIKGATYNTLKNNLIGVAIKN